VGSTHLFNAFGIPVRAHWSFWFCVFIVAWRLQEPGGIFPTAFGMSLLFMACFMGCLLLHELGHCLTARRFGINTREIKMTYIGGMAMFERSPREPLQELLVTAAGPLVNFVIAGLLFAGHFLTFGSSFEGWERGFFFYLMVFNLVLGIFNLLPGFPMDGGRILRALLALKLPYLRATHIAVRVGQLVAVGFIFWAITPPFNIGLILIGFFVLFLAQAELMRVRAEEALKRGPADLNRLFGSLFGAKASGAPNTRSWGFTFGAPPPGDAEAGPAQAEPPSPPRDDSDCVIDMDSDGKVRKVWRKDESED